MECCIPAKVWGAMCTEIVAVQNKSWPPQSNYQCCWHPRGSNNRQHTVYIMDEWVFFFWLRLEFDKPYHKSRTILITDIARLIPVWLCMGLNPINLSTTLPFALTKRKTKGSWSVCDKSGIESTIIEKYLAWLISSATACLGFSPINENNFSHTISGRAYLYPYCHARQFSLLKGSNSAISSNSPK